VEVTRVLLEHGADPWAAESSEWTPLNAAVTKETRRVGPDSYSSYGKPESKLHSGDELAPEAHTEQHETILPSSGKGKADIRRPSY
jgi:hypothetical protein